MTQHLFAKIWNNSSNVSRASSEANLITVNKKKSGILILNDDGTDPSVIMGYPVVSEYKYLGILLDSKLSPKHHICAMNKKLKEYLQRDKFLQK